MSTSVIKPVPHLNADSTAIDRLAASILVCSVAAFAVAIDRAVDLGGDRQLRKAARALRGKSGGRRTDNDDAALNEMQEFRTSGAARSIWRAAGLAAATRFGKQTELSLQKRFHRKFRKNFPRNS